ncbi:hypothetical protein LTR86_003304 [Recurvomyces mirabilis]|nr:hypothetical protein LTR86_003304 [Recurvomyces mirabilis]
MIIPGTIGGICMWIFFPDTKGIPLEEVAAIFGDAAEVAVYEREIDIDPTTHSIIAGQKGEKIEQVEREDSDV